jgi:hypothetical protein
MTWFRTFLRGVLAPRARYTVLVKNDELHYKLFYDSEGRLIFEMAREAGELPMQQELSRDQHDRWVREGPAYVQALYQATIREPRSEAKVRLDPVVAAKAEQDFPGVARARVFHHLSQYGPDRAQTVRVQLAILELASGDVHELKRHVQNAMIDYRDVLQLAHDFDEARPLADGALGIDPATGALKAADANISPDSTPAELKAAVLVEDLSDVVPETTVVSLTRPVDFGDARFNVALVFEHEGLAEAHLTMIGERPAAHWLRERGLAPERIYPWGKLDLEQEGDAPASIVMRYRY